MEGVYFLQCAAAIPEHFTAFRAAGHIRLDAERGRVHAPARSASRAAAGGPDQVASTLPTPEALDYFLACHALSNLPADRDPAAELRASLPPLMRSSAAGSRTLPTAARSSAAAAVFRELWRCWDKKWQASPAASTRRAGRSASTRAFVGALSSAR
jgi:hypothetical protein